MEMINESGRDPDVIKINSAGRALSIFIFGVEKKRTELISMGSK